MDKSKYKAFSFCLPGLLLFGMAPAHTAENTSSSEQVQPNLELLEFLGSFATDEGEWLDPNSLLEDEFSSLLGSIAEQTAPTVQQPDNSDTQDTAND